ncbi:MAG: hypothetical protein H7641_01960 [Candidatus Heimdallarchaeota archaeon]|nr:hypothetical protein [Candidatus Heimdallarchaeota archaeon]MCK4876328.1 hypothetical protein [Candidatus Heimdallarchaeota archaeon]
MKSSEKKKYIKYELTYQQKQKLLKLSKKRNKHPEEILTNIEIFFEEFIGYEDERIWENILIFFNSRLLEQKIKQRSDDIVDTKKKTKLQRDLLIEYEDDYLTIIELGQTLETLNKMK